LVSQHDLDAAIFAELGRLGAEMGLGRAQADGRGGFVVAGHGVSLRLRGVPATNEIEWEMEAPDWETNYIGADVIQEWRGEPLRACQFNESNFREVARLVCEQARPALHAFRHDKGAMLVALAEAEARIVDRSRLARLRDEAGAAWERGDHSRVVELLSQMQRSLSPVETKRLQIARRKLS